MTARIRVESNYEFACIFDDFLSNVGFARTRKNLEFYWQGRQNQRSRLLRTRCGFRQLFQSKTIHFGTILDQKAVKKHAGKQGYIFLRHWGAFGVPLVTFLGHEAVWPWVGGGTVEEQWSLSPCIFAPWPPRYY